jgi:DNA mismatch repair protein MutS2
MTFTHVPGVGEKNSQKLLSQINDYSDFHTRMQQCYFRELNMLDVDTKVSANIIQYYTAKKYNFEYVDCIKSQGVQRILNIILNSVKQHFTLKRNHRQLAAWYPTTNLSEIHRRQQFIEGSKNFSGRFTLEQKKQIRSLLKLSNIKTVAQEHVLVLCDEDQVYTALKKECPSWIQVVQLHSMNEIEGYLTEDFIRYAYTSESKFVSRFESIENIEVIPYTSIFDVVPEALVHRFRVERIFIETVLELSSEFGVHMSNLNIELLQSILDTLDENMGVGTLIDRVTVQHFCDKAERMVESKLSAMQVSGGELLRMLRTEVSQHTVLQDVIRLVKEELSCNPLDRDLLLYLDFSGVLPIIDEERIRSMEREHSLNRERRTYLHAKRFVNDFSGHTTMLDICKDILDNVDLLLGFGDAFETCSAPKVGSPFIELRGVKSRELSYSGVDVQPITYSLTSAETMITGANSGGKTSLLHLLGETVLLGMMGMHVMGNAYVPLYEELHFFKKSNGTVGSGAFETTLHSLSAIMQSERKGLVLIDEIESITEPGAAANLIAGTLDYLRDRNKDVVLVTHLGSVLSDLCSYARIDGIEASHLDNDFNLVVDRNPKMNYLAKSTPQLIIEKLSKKDESNQYFKFLYDCLS